MELIIIRCILRIQCPIPSTNFVSHCCQPDIVVLSSVISECVLTHLSCCVVSNVKWICFFFCVCSLWNIVMFNTIQMSHTPFPIRDFYDFFISYFKYISIQWHSSFVTNIVICSRVSESDVSVFRQQLISQQFTQ